MLESGGPVAAETVTHIDRCLSCLACMTTCPSGVNYMHLVDHGRRHIEETYRRPRPERLLRRLLGAVLPRPALFRLALRGAGSPSPSPAAAGAAAGRCWRWRLPGPARLARRPAAGLPGRGRAADAGGAAVRLRAAGAGARDQRGDDPAADPAWRRGRRRRAAAAAAARSPITSARQAPALAFARANIDAWERERSPAGSTRSSINASGCGTTLKDYGFMLRNDPAYAEKAARIAALARDVTEVVADARACRRPGRRSPRPAGRLSFGLLAAARPEDPPRAEGACCAAAGFAVARGAGGASVLRLGRHLQHAAAGARRGAARAQARQHRADPAPISSPPAISAASPSSPAAAPCRSCIRSSCSTGRPAGPAPRALSDGARLAGAPSPGSAATAPARRARLASATASRRRRRRALRARPRRRDRHRRPSAAAGRRAIQARRRRVRSRVRPSA